MFNQRLITWLYFVGALSIFPPKTFKFDLLVSHTLNCFPLRVLEVVESGRKYVVVSLY